MNCSSSYGKGGLKVNNFTHFKFWCQKVLPFVYDDSLSYYEVLCKVADYINKLIDDDKMIIDDIAELRAEMKTVQDWIDNFNTEWAEKTIQDMIATMIFVEISKSGYVIYTIPDTWQDITFNTTGLDINIPDTEYGQLVLSY